ncbi:MAG: hypothetical protein COA62_07310 [Rhodobiaceae bacterium]|nr:MAG: hypothetical protein COA62_07310 [Rhodobiaceae bacterium]
MESASPKYAFEGREAHNLTDFSNFCFRHKDLWPRIFLVKLHSHSRKAVTRLGAAISEGHRGHIIKFVGWGFRNHQAVLKNRSPCGELTDAMIWMFLFKKMRQVCRRTAGSVMETAK